MTYMIQLRNEEPARCVYVFKNGIVTYLVVAQVTLAAVFVNRVCILLVTSQCQLTVAVKLTSYEAGDSPRIQALIQSMGVTPYYISAL